MGEHKYDVIFLVPLHKKDERVFRAINSVPSGDRYKVIVITSDEIKKWAKGKYGNAEWIVSSEGTTYPIMVNLGIKHVESLNTEFISILEFDDVLTPNFEKVFKTYCLDDEEKDFGAFAPLCVVVREQGEEDKPALVGISNEAPFAMGLAEENGLYDFNMMLKTNFLFVNGCFIRPETFEEFGVFKTNFKLFYDYEWALRMVYNGVLIKSVPKVTHMHYMTDDGAANDISKAPNEVREKWLNASRREYFFDEERELDID